MLASAQVRRQIRDRATDLYGWRRQISVLTPGDLYAGAMALPAGGSNDATVVVRIPRMAHIASAFILLWLVLMMPAFGRWGLSLLLIPVVLSAAIERLRTTADSDTVTARYLVSTRTLPWTQVEGLKFTRGRWARACRPDMSEMRLPAVTFSTLPELTAASGGKVPNPYQ
jgi:hypothetical protein